MKLTRHFLSLMPLKTRSSQGCFGDVGKGERKLGKTREGMSSVFRYVTFLLILDNA